MSNCTWLPFHTYLYMIDVKKSPEISDYVNMYSF